MKKLSEENNMQIIKYLIAGVLAVIVNLSFFYILSENFMDIWWANFFSFIITVLFAYWTNTKFVFRQKFTKKNFLQFWTMRISAIFIDMGSLYLFIKPGFAVFIAKSLATFIVIVYNYISSKFFIFKKNE